MTGIDLYSAQVQIEDYVKANIPFFVDSGNIPDVTTLRMVNGVLDPYVILRFTPLMPSHGGGSFAGALYGEYYSYFDALCVGDTDRVARQLLGKVSTLVIGKTFSNVTEIKPNFGGGIFSIAGDTAHPLAFIATGSYRFNINIEDVGSGSTIVP